MVGKKYFFVLFIFIISLGVAQEENNWLRLLDADISKEQKITSIDSILFKYKGVEDSLLESLTHKYATWLSNQNENRKAIEIANYSLQIKRKYFAQDTVLLQRGIYNIAKFYYKLNNYKKSIEYYDKTIRLKSDNYVAAYAYMNQAVNYQYLGDHYRSLELSELAQSLFDKNQDYYYQISTITNMQTSYLALNNKKYDTEILQRFLFADSLSTAINSDENTKFKIKIVLGDYYNQDRKLVPEKASFYYNQALQLARSVNDSVSISLAYTFLGNLYDTIDPKKSTENYKKALVYEPSNSFSEHIILSNIGLNYILLKEFDKGIHYYEKAFKALTGIKLYPHLNISTKEVYQNSKSTYLYILMQYIAEGYLKKYQYENTPEILSNAIKYFLLADQLMDIIRIESQEFQSKLYWREQSAALYGKAIEACYLTKDVEKAFFFMEKNKALLLSEDLHNTKIRQSKEIPPQIADREIKLKKNIYFLEKQDSGANDSIKIILLDEKRKLKQLQDSILSFFPEYDSFTMQPSNISIKDIQQNIDDHTVVLEYNISDYDMYGTIAEHPKYTPLYEGATYGKYVNNDAYLICITKNKVDFIKLVNIDKLKEQVEVLVQKAAKPFATKEEIKSYAALAYRVYSILFPNDEIRNLIKDKKIRIIPDSYLNYLPFEALVTTQNIEDKPHFLIEDTEVSYLYSNSFRANSKRINEIDQNSFLGFAPRTFDIFEMSSLENSVQELQNIQLSYEGEIFTEENATKEAFMKSISKHNIIHLATHADAVDSISPWIAFRNAKLNLEELYFTKNTADLVVLSGCNTMLGAQKTGEGVMSLARGFFHSGAQSVVSSLWNVDDRSTTYIMDLFYKNLKEGQSKSKALRNAKLEYLQNHSLAEASPHFWATFILSGDTNSIEVTSLPLGYLMIILGIAVAFFIFCRRKK